MPQSVKWPTSQLTNRAETRQKHYVTILGSADWHVITDQWICRAEAARKVSGTVAHCRGPVSDDSDTEVILGGAVWRAGPGHASSMHSGKRVL
jgi:hypothetical protein